MSPRKQTVSTAEISDSNRPTGSGKGPIAELADRWVAGVLFSQSKKVKSLLEDFQIPHGPYEREDLAIAMANRVRRPADRRARTGTEKGGRPKKWNWIVLEVLFVDLNREMHSRTHLAPKSNVVNAARRLAKREPWRSFVGVRNQKGNDDWIGLMHDPAEVLRKRYADAKKDRHAHRLAGLFQQFLDKRGEKEWAAQISGLLARARRLE